VELGRTDVEGSIFLEHPYRGPPLILYSVGMIVSRDNGRPISSDEPGRILNRNMADKREFDAFYGPSRSLLRAYSYDAGSWTRAGRFSSGRDPGIMVRNQDRDITRLTGVRVVLLSRGTLGAISRRCCRGLSVGTFAGVPFGAIAEFTKAGLAARMGAAAIC
jgi:hypothetical protein